ncbi:MAG: ATP-dependent helicase [Leptospiraceae bacterium]|nr:UvrD-helicase domain-containing protein [Leptospiraceae bacterium]MCK6382185.1 ATP-dependent helicase [Leptospiraceae bacterium]NUM42405.1 UvrD-helicase domain-containing protein [Leptospiraceae bacterium]
MNLNSEQKKAVEHVKGPLLIFAGAGSGKTRVITNRIVNLITKEKVKPSEIVALSFTNKSAKELRERVFSMVGRKGVKGIELSTFHSFGLKLLKKFIENLDYKNPFSLLSPSDLEPIVIGLLKEKKLDPKKFPIYSILSKLSFRKNSNSFQKQEISELEEYVEAIFENYSEKLKSINSIDFDDLILLPIVLLKNFKEVKDYCHKKYKFYMVDEFQDTNQSQYELVKLLLGKNDNLCVVGDDDQSIYGFRGGDVNLILNFEKDFPHAKNVQLMQNYRSSKNILEAANSLIQKNPTRVSKELYSSFHYPEKVKYVEREDEKDEASFVIDEIEREILKEKRKGGEIAILFRTNYQSRPFEEELRLRSIPYRLFGAYNFFDRKEVKDILAYLRVLANPKDELSLLRILNYPKRGIGDTAISKIHKASVEKNLHTIDVLYALCESDSFVEGLKKNVISEIYEFLETIEKYKKRFFGNEGLSFVLKDFIKEIGFEKEIQLEEDNEKIAKARILNLFEILNMLKFFEEEWDSETKPTLFDFLLKISLLTNDDTNDSPEENKVNLMTMHLSKGLEFETVFLTGVEEGIIPSSRSMEFPTGEEEERRLMYVGMTRAKKKLYLTSTRGRKKFGESVPSIPSRFLSEINQEYLDRFLIESEEENSGFNFIAELEKLKIV